MAGAEQVRAYVYDQAWQEERKRLGGMERLWDEGTFALLDRLGVGPGSAVAEVGAGAGSVVEWLAARVGPKGRVLATDVYLKFIAPLAGGPVEISEHDIRSQALPSGEFDLVHTRLLVEHVRAHVLANLCAGVRSGGVLLVEDYDMGCRGIHPEDAGWWHVADALLELMAAAGFDRFCGRKLPAELEALGLEDVHAEGRVRLIRSGTPDTAFFRLSLETLSGTLVEQGRVERAEVDAALERLEAPGTTALSPLMVACWGRRA
jgi:SAM-dependent methyltransferase